MHQPRPFAGWAGLRLARRRRRGSPHEGAAPGRETVGADVLATHPLDLTRLSRPTSHVQPRLGAMLPPLSTSLAQTACKWERGHVSDVTDAAAPELLMQFGARMQDGLEGPAACADEEAMHHRPTWRASGAGSATELLASHELERKRISGASPVIPSSVSSMPFFTSGLLSGATLHFICVGAIGVQLWQYFAEVSSSQRAAKLLRFMLCVPLSC
ncbi:hypothetical protein B0H15DRAFT_947463 [Mycena belliarum]|uniref:Uncharacterized protein n=1 Tax=Mycena belliarum TaxID=1033014 RepID=A0AAD6U6X8_9AGAR|nr:hypothetical protein B0H15DRAFT_947463 [Mycena belliae]